MTVLKNIKKCLSSAKHRGGSTPAKFDERLAQRMFKKLESVCGSAYSMEIYMEILRATTKQCVQKRCVRNIVSSMRENKNLMTNKASDVVKWAIYKPHELGSEFRKSERRLVVETYATLAPACSSPGMFRCGRCGSKKTRFTQSQTRSGDEGMVCRVMCMDCEFCFKF
jgi:transcription elongation factor S-II